MNTTTNYGLKQYDGTDLFNPLTVENVNMGNIDTALKSVSDHAVGTATELTTGTVHALNRTDTDRDVFAFVATSNYESGDTFTLDGVQVSALTPDGQTLATGSYVIGSMVLCALHDTLITVYVNPAKAKDSYKLDGHDSSYFATDSDLDTVAGTIGAISDKVGSAVLTTTAPDLSGAVNELNTHLSANENITVTPASGITINSSFTSIKRLGNRVVISATLSGTITNRAPLFTLPSGYRPSVSGAYGIAIVQSATQCVGGAVTILASGGVDIAMSTPISGNSANLHIEYMI